MSSTKPLDPHRLLDAAVGATGRPALTLLGGWLLAMIGLPIAVWTFGPGALRVGVPLAVMLQALAVLAVLARFWGARRTLIVAACAATLAWCAEALGCTYGAPFGQYAYSDLLQPTLGPVPAIIPLAWLMMLPPSWAVAHCLVGDARRSPLAFAAVSAVAFTTWDLFLDPQMVAWGFWSWSEPGGYFGIPWENFLGWLAVSGGITLLVRPDRLPVGPLVAVYAVTWFLESFGLAAFWGLPGPALFGFLGMGGVLALAVHSHWRPTRRIARGILREAGEVLSQVASSRAARDPRS